MINREIKTTTPDKIAAVRAGMLELYTDDSEYENRKLLKSGKKRKILDPLYPTSRRRLIEARGTTLPLMVNLRETGRRRRRSRKSSKYSFN